MNNSFPLFILSNPRSGSSLLRVICDAHQNITVPPECGFTEWWYDKYKNWKVEDNLSDRFKEYCSDLKSSRKFETWNFDFYIFENLTKKKLPKNYSDLSALVHLSYGLQKDKKVKIWGDKNNYYIHKTNLLRKLYPKAKYLFIIRDGRDVATSYRAIKTLKTQSPYVPQLPVEIEEIARQWNRNNLKVLSFLDTIKKENVLTLRYEDLVMNFRQTCKLICSFLQVSIDPSMLRYYELGLEPIETLDWKKKTLLKPESSSIGKYKKLLTQDELKLFNAIAEESLIRFDYEL